MKKLIFYIFTPLILGALIGFLSGSFNGFNDVNTPSFIPAKILFPIVWSILYILMGISRYLIRYDLKSVFIYNTQLVVNLFWSFFFFSFKWYLFSFLWIIVLIVLVSIMIVRFYKENKIAGLIQIPYLLWIIFAGILNLSIYILN